MQTSLNALGEQKRPLQNPKVCIRRMWVTRATEEYHLKRSGMVPLASQSRHRASRIARLELKCNSGCRQGIMHVLNLIDRIISLRLSIPTIRPWSTSYADEKALVDQAWILIVLEPQVNPAKPRITLRLIKEPMLEIHVESILIVNHWPF